MQTIEIDGKSFVILPRSDYDRLAALAKSATTPPLPEPDADGNYPAVEYARASLARKMIRDRAAARLSQAQLAKLTGLRVETICRLEAGKHTPSIATVDKIYRALEKFSQPKEKRRKQ